MTEECNPNSIENYDDDDDVVSVRIFIFTTNIKTRNLEWEFGV